jgi:hypothetical protein
VALARRGCVPGKNTGTNCSAAADVVMAGRGRAFFALSRWPL